MPLTSTSCPTSRASTPAPAPLATPTLTSSEKEAIEQSALADDRRVAEKELAKYIGMPLESKNVNLVRFWDVRFLAFM
jgi:hypothetical protein